MTDEREISGRLTDFPDIFSGKIRAMLEAYGTRYDFCTFYTNESVMIGSYYGAATVCGETIPDDNELADFLSMSFGELLLPREIFDKSIKHTALTEIYNLSTNLVMKQPCNESVTLLSEIANDVKAEEISLGEAYEIIKDGFDIEFDKWYTDTSHNLRHGISKIYGMEKSACTIRMFSYNGISYYSYAAAKTENRGQGLTSALFEQIINMEHRQKNDVYVICTHELRGFYERLGFRQSGEAVSLIKNNKRNERKAL